MRDLQAAAERLAGDAEILRSASVRLLEAETGTMGQVARQLVHLSELVEGLDRLGSLPAGQVTRTVEEVTAVETLEKIDERLRDLRKRVDIGRREARERSSDQIDLVRLLQAQYLGRLDRAREAIEEAVALLHERPQPE